MTLFLSGVAAGMVATFVISTAFVLAMIRPRTTKADRKHRKGTVLPALPLEYADPDTVAFLIETDTGVLPVGRYPYPYDEWDE